MVLMETELASFKVMYFNGVPNAAKASNSVITCLQFLVHGDVRHLLSAQNIAEIFSNSSNWNSQC